tara:strand:- start:192 stop:398 length:207 start_codon:yes stop_codon:yes gene_type:complete
MVDGCSNLFFFFASLSSVDWYVLVMLVQKLMTVQLMVHKLVTVQPILRWYLTTIVLLNVLYVELLSVS